MPHPLTSLPLCAAVVGGFGDCMKTARNSGNYEETGDLKSAMEAVANGNNRLIDRWVVNSELTGGG